MGRRDGVEMGVLIYNKSDVEDILEACQPIAGFENVGPVLLGTPIESEDGRYAHIHAFSEEEMDFLEARVSGIVGALVLDAIPKDWVAKSEK